MRHIPFNICMMKGIWGKTAVDKVMMKNRFRPPSVVLTVLSVLACGSNVECVFVSLLSDLHACVFLMGKAIARFNRCGRSSEELLTSSPLQKSSERVI